MNFNHQAHKEIHEEHKNAIAFFVHSLCSLWLKNPHFLPILLRSYSPTLLRSFTRAGGISMSLDFFGTFFVTKKSTEKKYYFRDAHQQLIHKGIDE